MKKKRSKNFDLRLWTRFWRIARPYWVLDERWAARGFLALLVVLLLVTFFPWFVEVLPRLVGTP